MEVRSNAESIFRSATGFTLLVRCEALAFQKLKLSIGKDVLHVKPTTSMVPPDSERVLQGDAARSGDGCAGSGADVCAVRHLTRGTDGASIMD